MAGRRLHGDICVARPAGSQSLALAHPLGRAQPAYTHKEAGLPAQVDLWLGDEIIAGPALASLDWTVGWMARDTRWKWASTAWLTRDGRRAGLNLSAEVYEDVTGAGRENALWLDGQVWPLSGVRFELPARPDEERWRIFSPGDDTVELRFQPQGARREALHLGLIVSSFVQPYGRFSGYVHPPGGPRLELDGAVGVVEDHHSRW